MVKFFSDAQGDVQRGLEVAEFAQGIPHLIKGEFNDNVSTGIDMYSMRKPLWCCCGYYTVQFPGDDPTVDEAVWQLLVVTHLC